MNLNEYQIFRTGESATTNEIAKQRFALELFKVTFGVELRAIDSYHDQSPAQYHFVSPEHSWTIRISMEGILKQLHEEARPLSRRGDSYEI